jgi:hypothetical protein
MPPSSARAVLDSERRAAAAATAQPIRRRLFDFFAVTTRTVIANLRSELASSSGKVTQRGPPIAG